MNSKFHNLFKLMAVILSMTFIACSSEDEENIVAVTQITVSPASLVLNVGETEDLEATILPEEASHVSVTWSSSDEKVAAVSQNGTVTGVSEGNAAITVSAGGKSATCQVTIATETIEVESIEISPSALTMTEKGETVQLTAEITPENATDPQVIWASSDEMVATVTSEGLVTAVAEGKATITATAGEKTASCEVTVSISIAEIEGNKATIDLTDATSEQVIQSVSEASAAGVTHFVIIGNYAALDFANANPFDGIAIEMLDLSGVSGWPSVGGQPGMPEKAFYKHELIQEIILPEEVKTVGEYAFYKCTALKKVTAPGIETLTNYAFQYCTALESVDMTQVKNIEKCVFFETALKEANFPQTTIIGAMSFYHCTSLISVNMPELVTLGEATKGDQTKRTGAAMFYGCTSLENISLPKAVTIGDEAFNGCKTLKEVNLPEATNFGIAVFSYCNALTEIALPKANFFSQDVFTNCPALTTLKLTYPGSITVDSSTFGPVNSQTKNIDLTLNTSNKYQIQAIDGPHGFTYQWKNHQWKSITCIP